MFLMTYLTLQLDINTFYESIGICLNTYLKHRYLGANIWNTPIC